MTYVKYTLVHPNALMPLYMSEGAAGADIFSCERVTIGVNESALVRTGVCIEMHAGIEAQIRSRSGLALRHGVKIFQGVGTIDSDFRGEIKALLINMGSEPFFIKEGDRIAQIVFAPVLQAEFLNVPMLNNSDRSTSGWGSTGK